MPTKAENGRLKELRRQLRVWVANHDTSIAGLARRVGVGRTQLSNVMYGHSYASLPLALRIEDATGIPVRLFDWKAKDKAA